MVEYDPSEYATRNPKTDGTRGAAWRKYENDMKAVCRGRFSRDDEYSWFKVLMRTEEGGSAPTAIALSNQAGGAGGDYLFDNRGAPCPGGGGRGCQKGMSRAQLIRLRPGRRCGRAARVCTSHEERRERLAAPAPAADATSRRPAPSLMTDADIFAFVKSVSPLMFDAIVSRDWPVV